MQTHMQMQAALKRPGTGLYDAALKRALGSDHGFCLK